ncbi:fibrinogen C domain-containing protein 1-like [Corticium candelabrum]|uniref:fibrinogen C domain-containing protein 1-like n=1 Tax=Corticium candelabrum TaxID=121492 RepID=UPI002E268BC6|nr:fibrinogen C domain-containing protein 1-like [Corticium candelabrum]
MRMQLALMITLPIVATALTHIGGDGDVNVTATGNIHLSATSVTVNGRPLDAGQKGDVGAAGPPGKPAPDACHCCDRLAALELELARVGLATSLSRNCKEILSTGYRRSGVYTVDPRDGLGAFKVYCDMTTDGGGWTVFQRRQDGYVDFYRNWADYKAGFGDLNGEFWLGLDKIHRLTATNQTLRFDMKDFENEERYALYSTFAVGKEAAGYKLTVGQYSGNAGDSFASYHNGMKFSTKDQDNDSTSSNCAATWFGGWWYNNCHHSNLNGKYLKGSSANSVGVNWKHWKGFTYSLKFTEMKTRPAV